MNNFVYNIPTKVYFGENQLSHLGEELSKYGTRVLMTYGGGSIKKNGLYDRIMDEMKKAGLEVCAVGKISDIFNGNGITQSIHTKDNMQGVDAVIDYLKSSDSGLIFANLVDFDAKYGHRRDPEGYGHAIEEFDARIPDIMAAMGEQDMLILCADHGNDPVHEGWNHTREYIPVIIYGKEIMVNNNLGTLSSFADVGATICDYLGVTTDGAGESLLKRILK